MTATITSSATVPSTSTPTSGLRSALASKPVWLVGVASTVVAAVAAALVAAVAKTADVPLAVAPSSGEPVEAIPTAGFAMMVLAAGAVGVVLALAFNRWARRPARTFVAVTGVLTAASFVTPTSVVAIDATTATRLVLALTHVVTAAIIIPPIASRLAHR
jgi:hypothetical protein